jgi:hypothetical protein
LDVLHHILTDHFEFAVLDIRELMDDQMGVVAAEIVKEHRYLVIDTPLEIAQLMGGADEKSRDVVVVTDFRTFGILITEEWLATDVTLSGVVVLLLLDAGESLHLDIVL